MLSNHSYANGVEKWLDLSLQVATNLWLPVYTKPPPKFPERALHSCTGQFNIQERLGRQMNN